MIKIIAAVCSLVIAGPVLAEKNKLTDYVKINKEILCHNKEDIFKLLSGPEFKERPIWLGKDPINKTEFIVLVNEQKKTFTIIQIAESIACIIGVGTDSYNNFLRKTVVEQ